jgi:hypothetical protein
MEELDFTTLFLAIISLIFMTIAVVLTLQEVKREVTSPDFRREKRIKILTYRIDLANLFGKEMYQEELDELKKETDGKYGDILDYAEQKDEWILELQKEAEDLKKLKNENEKLLKIIAEQKKKILDLKMELNIKESEK